MTTLRALSSALPSGRLTNAELRRRHPEWGIDQVADMCGVVSRSVVSDGETAFDLSVRACEALFEQPGVDPAELDAIVYCTQAPDYPAPGNSQLLHKHFGLAPEVLSFDYTLACSGYVYGLGIADSFVRSGLASEVLLVTAETMSTRIGPEDRSAVALFGDGAAASLLSGSPGGDLAKVGPVRLCSQGEGYERVYVPAGGARRPSDHETKKPVADANGNIRSAEDVQMDGRAVWAFVISTVPGHIRGFLADHGLEIGDVDLLVPHQASRMTFDSLARELGIPVGKIYSNMEEIGNLSSASIPVALRDAIDEGAIGAGDRVLLSGFGAGLSYGSAILEF